MRKSLIQPSTYMNALAHALTPAHTMHARPTISSADLFVEKMKKKKLICVNNHLRDTCIRHFSPSLSPFFILL
jgi:hypothetical protein